MVWCRDCRARFWGCYVSLRAKSGSWSLDQPMGTSPRRMDQPMGWWSRALDQPLGWSSSGKFVDQSVVIGTLDLFACPRRITRLSGYFRLLWRRHQVMNLLLSSSEVGMNFADGSGSRPLA